MAMEIEGWAIDAFGALSDVEHRGVNSGLSVIYGPNEAGKSTLRHFVLGVLFGFSPSTGRDLPYSPSSGGFRSGRLFLRNDDEELTITRVEQRNARGGVVTLLGADGTARADAELAALLGGLNRQVYNRIFAVGLDELNDLAALTDGDLQDHLLSAGVTGAGRIATQARNKLRTRAEELHKPRAQSTKVSSLREQLRAIDEELRNSQRAAAELTDRRQDLVDSRANVDDLATRERAALAKASRARRLGELWPAFVEAGEAASFLDLLGADSGALPADAAATLAARQAAVEAANEEVSRRQTALAEAETAFSQLESGHRPELAGLHTDVAALQHRLSAWAQQEEELERRREELTDLQRRLDFELDVVGVPDPAEL
ncbi:MAG TPA: AAA family ATPase, partial [Acidimicrobiales bacterium]